MLCCPIPREGTPQLIGPSEPLKVWVRAVYRDHVNLPVQDTTISLGLVDSFGTDIPIDGRDFSISPQEITTMTNGYSVPIVFLTSQQGHYRIKASYRDKNSQGVSYGPLLIVQR